MNTLLKFNKIFKSANTLVSGARCFSYNRYANNADFEYDDSRSFSRRGGDRYSGNDRFNNYSPRGYGQSNRSSQYNNSFNYGKSRIKKGSVNFDKSRGGVNGIVPEEKWLDSGDLEIEQVQPIKKQTNADGTPVNVENAYADIPVKLSGHNSELVQPLLSFKNLTDIDRRLLNNVHRLNYDATTPVQRISIPSVLAGNDLLALAQTGSGKTAAFLVPVLQHLLTKYPKEAFNSIEESFHETQFPTCLIIAPTRELVQQITEQAHEFTKGTPFRTVAVYGGANRNSQVSDVMRGAHMVVATPGRLIDLLQNDYLSLKCSTKLVLDEADRCFDMGFEPQIREIVKSHQYKMPSTQNGRQTLLFSATFPKEIRKLAEDFLSEDYHHLVVGTLGQIPKTIIQQFYQVESFRDKHTKLVELFEEESGQVLVFCQTKLLCDKLERMLQYNNIRCNAIHGDKSQSERDNALQLFRQGRTRALLATDVAARGLDIPNVNMVVNFGAPQTDDQYTHRIGRTGRLGRKGRAVTLMATSDPSDIANFKNVRRELAKLVSDAGQEVPSVLQQDFPVGRGYESRNRFDGGGNRGRDRYDRPGRGGRFDYDDYY